MLVDLVARVLRVPAARRRLWRGWYGYLARRDRGTDWTFMNYGYRADVPLELEADLEPDRWCIQLYDLLAASAALAGRDVLEVGSGRGGGAAWVHERHGPRSTTGVDFAAANVAFCRSRHHAPGLAFVVGNAEALPFPDDSFDAVLNVESSHCYGSRARFYREAARVLRPAGRMQHADLFDPAELDEVRAAMRDAGLETLAEQDIGPRVVEAMELDDARKRGLIEQRVPGWLRGLFGHFAGLEGTTVHRALCSGELAYLRFDLRAPA